MMLTFRCRKAGAFLGSVSPILVTPTIVVAPDEFELRYWMMIPFFVIISFGTKSQTTSFSRSWRRVKSSLRWRREGGFGFTTSLLSRPRKGGLIFLRLSNSSSSNRVLVELLIALTIYFLMRLIAILTSLMAKLDCFCLPSTIYCGKTI